MAEFRERRLRKEWSTETAEETVTDTANVGQAGTITSTATEGMVRISWYYRSAPLSLKIAL